MFCPNCKNKLSKNPKHAEGIWLCEKCHGIFHIIITTKPKPNKKVVDKSSISKLLYPHQKELIKWLKPKLSTPVPNNIIDLDKKDKRND